MEKTIWSGYGVDLIKRDNKFFVKYDAGELCVSYVESEITEVEAELLQKGEKEAYEVILTSQNRNGLF